MRKELQHLLGQQLMAFEIFRALVARNETTWDFDPIAKEACDAAEAFTRYIDKRYPERYLAEAPLPPGVAPGMTIIGPDTPQPHEIFQPGPQPHEISQPRPGGSLKRVWPETSQPPRGMAGPEGI